MFFKVYKFIKTAKSVVNTAEAVIDAVTNIRRKKWAAICL